VLDRFRHIVDADFEFQAGSGERPRVVCMVAKELRSGQTWRLWRGEFGPEPPFPVDSSTLFVAYYASAELGCFKALNWPQPEFVLDLFTEFRARTNGLNLPNGVSMLGAATYFGIDGVDITGKQDMRELILSGGPWSEDERQAILDYCASDVSMLEKLLKVMLPRIDLPRALLRGRFMKAAAAIEWNGTPIDAPMLERLRRHWTEIQDSLIAGIDAGYGVFEGRSFRRERWERWLQAHNIPWPTLESGQTDLSDDTFRHMARAYPEVAPMRELRSALSELRLNDLAVGSDGRNRTLLSAFRSRTGRCQPSNTRYIFGPSVWLRSLIKPPKGFGIAYIDWCHRSMASPPPCPAIRLCGPPISRVIRTSNSPSRPALSPPMLLSARMARPGNCSSSVFWRWPTAWEPKGSHGVSASRRSSAVICCELTMRPIATSGNGAMRWSTMHCSPARCKRCLVGRCNSAIVPILARCAISHARPTVAKCCAWPPALPPSKTSKSAP